MRFIRWMNAFRKSNEGIAESVQWEITVAWAVRQVAVEPLHRGRSLLRRRGATIGLVVDEQASTFVKGFYVDAYTEESGNGILYPQFAPNTRQGKGEKNMDRFLATWNKLSPDGHGEVIFQDVHYKGVVVKGGNEDDLSLAKEISKQYGLKLYRIKGRK